MNALPQVTLPQLFLCFSTTFVDVAVEQTSLYRSNIMSTRMDSIFDFQFSVFLLFSFVIAMGKAVLANDSSLWRLLLHYIGIELLTCNILSMEINSNA